MLALVLALVCAASALASEPTNAGDNLRDGWYPEQTSLTPQLVSGGTFGKLWTTSVEGSVYAQPLLADGIVLVATEANKVYGLDPATGSVHWSSTLTSSTPWNASDIGCADLTPTIGVTATPVVDPSTNIAYMTHKTYVSGSSGPAVWFMDAIELATGKEKAGWPVQLSGSAQNAPSQTFQATTQLQRPGLLLLEGHIYAAFGSDCDHEPWQGWVFGVSTAGQVTARWTTRPVGSGAGIWQSGAGLTSDGPGTLMISTGNGGAQEGPISGKTPPASLGESIVRLAVQPDGSLKPVDFFSPFDAKQLDGWDADFASGGITALNDSYFGTSGVPHLAVAVGKNGYVYLLNRENLGGIGEGPSGSDNVVQRIGPYGGVWSRPGVWPGEGGWIYIPTASGGTTGNGTSGFLRVYQYGVSAGGEPSLSLQATSPDVFGFSSGAPVITSSGTTAGTALVWMEWTTGSSGSGGQLRAYDPIPKEGKPVLRWSAPIGTTSKFATPGVAGNRLFVGNREGKVMGFGSPVTPVMSGPPTTFPTTTDGSTSEQTVTLTANSALTLKQLTTTNTQFKLGTPSLTLPATMSAGQSIKVPVSFEPTTTGAIAGTLNAETSLGTVGFSLAGTGQTAGPLLSTSPTVVSFGGTTLGGRLTSAATIRNLGATPLKINSVKLPSGPFTASGAPEAGTTIEPGQAITITLSFEPTEEGNFTGEIAFETNGGNGAIGLVGSAGTPGVLQITGERTEYGNVEVGASVTRSFTIKNTGGTPVEITKSKPPIGGEFAATTTLSEGTTIAPGETLTESVTFAPSAAGWGEGAWVINGDDTTGLHEIQFSGAGTVPAPGGAWTHNGAATIASGVVTTTPASTFSAGSAFFNTPLDSSDLVVEFEQTIGGGTGADGQAVVFADASKATPKSLGANGGGLGFAGIPGIAVASDTYKNSVNPSSNFVGISDGPGSASNLLHWLATSTAVPSLRSGTHRIKVQALSGTITVWVDDTQVLSDAVTLPPKVLLGFTGGTGGLTDVHMVAGVVISGKASTVEPPPASLKLTSTINAPGGSEQAATKLAFSGSCPSSFTTAALGNGESATPTLTGAVAGASCSVSAAAPSGSGWKTAASVNGGPAVELTPSGGQVTVPTFALAAGENKLTLTSTYTEPASSLVPDPSAGGWQLNGSAKLESPSLVLTGVGTFLGGSAFWPTQLSAQNRTIEFEMTIGGGTGADGLALVFADASKGATPKSLGESGGGLGFGGIPGIAVAFDTYKNAVNPSNNFVGISEAKGTEGRTLRWLSTANVTPSLRATHKIKVATEGGTVGVWIDGTKVGSFTVTLPTKAYIGFTGATGGLTDRHAIAHLTVK
jgi:hypothetical protein